MLGGGRGTPRTGPTSVSRPSTATAARSAITGSSGARNRGLAVRDQHRDHHVRPDGQQRVHDDTPPAQQHDPNHGQRHERVVQAETDERPELRVTLDVATSSRICWMGWYSRTSARDAPAPPRQARQVVLDVPVATRPVATSRTDSSPGPPGDAARAQLYDQ